MSFPAYSFEVPDAFWRSDKSKALELEMSMAPQVWTIDSDLYNYPSFTELRNYCIDEREITFGLRRGNFRAEVILRHEGYNYELDTFENPDIRIASYQYMNNWLCKVLELTTLEEYKIHKRINAEIIS